jgi:beta-aspartyl-peptidase (threonine type)
VSESAPPPPVRPTRNWSGVALASLALTAILVGAAWAGSAWVSHVRRAEAGHQAEAILKEQVAAWNDGDLDRFLDTYWDSDELIFFSGGTVSRGLQAVRERYRKRYQAEGKEMGRLTFADLEVTPLGADSALARGRWQLVMSGGKVQGLFTLLLRQLPQGWKIVHDHTSQADPPKPQ